MKTERPFEQVTNKDKYLSAARSKLLNMHGFVDATRRNQVL
jgi:hypothetical protein